MIADLDAGDLPATACGPCRAAGPLGRRSSALAAFGTALALC